MVTTASKDAWLARRHDPSPVAEVARPELAMASGERETAGLDPSSRSVVRMLIDDVVASMDGPPRDVRVDLAATRVHVEIHGRPTGAFGLVAELSDRWGLRHGDGPVVWFEVDR